jgi:hypothetical protein|tara:strand:- start:28 stop:756 length:729 start_codon:yes stop_codon:yes gene_type:complete
MTNQTEKKAKSKKKRNYYFTSVTQEKIIEYQNCNTKRKKDSIYSEHIHPAFTELVHNLVSVYKYKSANENILHLKSDCVAFLFETIHKWNPDKGTKAFSYFNVVAKNWLTINSRRLLKHARRSVCIDVPEDFTLDEKRNLAEIDIVMSHEEVMLKKERYNAINEMFCYIKGLLKDDRDIRCINAIIHVFNNIDSLDYLNKRAVFVYLREISGLNSPELSSSLSNIRKHYRKTIGPSNMFDLF